MEQTNRSINLQYMIYYETEYQNYFKKGEHEHGNGKESKMCGKNQRRKSVQEFRLREIQILCNPQEEIVVNCKIIF